MFLSFGVGEKMMNDKRIGKDEKEKRKKRQREWNGMRGGGGKENPLFGRIF